MKSDAAIRINENRIDVGLKIGPFIDTQISDFQITNSSIAFGSIHTRCWTETEIKQYFRDVKMFDVFGRSLTIIAKDIFGRNIKGGAIGSVLNRLGVPLVQPSNRTTIIQNVSVTEDNNPIVLDGNRKTDG